MGCEGTYAACEKRDHAHGIFDICKKDRKVGKELEVIEMKKAFQAPESPHRPSPAITPHMIETAMHALETKGMIYYSEGGVYIPTEKGWKLLMEVGGREEIIANGHAAIQATDDNGFIITKQNSPEKYPKAIVAVSANKSCRDFDKKFRNSIKAAKKIEIVIEAGGIEDRITAFCSPAMTLTSAEEIAIRKDDRIDGKTVGILASKSASELSQDLIEQLRKPESEVKITLEIK